MSSFRKLLTFTTLAGVLSASTAGAQQSIEQLRAKFLLPVPTGLDTELGRFPRGSPGTSTGSPGAFGANWNDGFVGAGFQAPVRYSVGGVTDGSMSAGFGLGNANNIAGVEVALNFLSTVRSGVGNRMGISTKVHKILQNNWGVALGVNGVMLQPNKDDRNSVYGVVTKVFQLESGYAKSFTASLGAGNGLFQTAGNLNSGKNGIGVFASGALRVNEMASVIVDWPGQDLNVGVSFVPFHSLPLVISPAIADITGSSNSGLTVGPTAKKTGPRFVLGVGFSFRFTAPKESTGPARNAAVDESIDRSAAAAVAAAEERRRSAAAAAAAAAQAARDDEARRAAAAAEAARIAAQRGVTDEAGRPVIGSTDAVRATLAATIYYDFDKDDIRADQQATLDSKVPILQANPAVKLRLAGHTDERGSDEYNQALGQRRAASAKRYLVARGIAESRIETTSFGEDRPVDAGHTEDAWAKNRRTEFEVTAGGETIRAPQR